VKLAQYFIVLVTICADVVSTNLRKNTVCKCGLNYVKPVTINISIQR